MKIINTTGSICCCGKKEGVSCGGGPATFKVITTWQGTLYWQIQFPSYRCNASMPGECCVLDMLPVEEYDGQTVALQCVSREGYFGWSYWFWEHRLDPPAWVYANYWTNSCCTIVAPSYPGTPGATAIIPTECIPDGNGGWEAP